MRAADPKKVKNLSDAVTAIKRKTKNVALNLETGAFDVKDAAGSTVKSFAVAKGVDATYAINGGASTVAAAERHLAALKKQAVTEAAPLEVQFAEKEDDLLKAVAAWKGADPGTSSRRDLSIQVGALQNELAELDSKMRGVQYKHRGAVDVGPIKRRMFIPASFDDRVMPFGVYRLAQTQTNAVMRVVAVAVTAVQPQTFVVPAAPVQEQEEQEQSPVQEQSQVQEPVQEQSQEQSQVVPDQLLDEEQAQKEEQKKKEEPTLLQSLGVTLGGML